MLDRLLIFYVAFYILVHTWFSVILLLSCTVPVCFRIKLVINTQWVGASFVWMIVCKIRIFCSCSCLLNLPVKSSRLGVFHWFRLLWGLWRDKMQIFIKAFHSYFNGSGSRQNFCFSTSFLLNYIFCGKVSVLLMFSKSFV